MKQNKLLVNKSLLFALVALSVICLVEYSYAYEWEKTFGGSEPDHGYSVQQTTDGGYIIAGYTYSFSGVTTDANVYLIKTDADGNEDWSNTFGGGETDHGYSVQQTTDGGYIIAGHTYSFSGVTPDADVYLIKTDADGNEDWSNTFGGGEFDYGRSVQQTTDGGYIIAGSTSPFSGATWDANVYLIKTDADGNEDWSNTFGGSGTHNGHSVQQTTDGGYIIAGYTYSYSGVSTDPAVYLIKTDADGNEDWSNTFGGGGTDSGYSVQQTTDGGYIIAGYTYSYSGVSPDAAVYLIKTDADGNEDWSNTFGGGEFDYGRSVQQTTDGGYIIAGYTCSPFVFTDADVYLIKTDAEGNEDWSNTFGGSGSDYGYSVQQTTDGGYIIAGVTGSFGAGSSDVYLIYYNPRTVGDELAVDFGGNGLWHYDGSTWTQLNGQDPEAMEEWDGGLASDFSTSGLWNYDGSLWNLLTTLNPQGMKTWANGLAVDFSTTGLWNYNGSSWDLLTTNDPQDMKSWTDGLAVDFGTFGLWNYDGSSWNLLTTSNAQNMTAWSGGLAVDFGTFGLWNYNGSTWDLLTTSDAQGMEAWSGGLAVDFSTFGLWNYNGSSWNLLTTSDAEFMAAWASGLVVDFGGIGLWNYTGSSWDLLTTSDAQDMEGWASSLAVDLGISGLWSYDGSSWASLSGWDSEDMIDVDLY